MKPVSARSLSVAEWRPVSQARVRVTEVLRPAAPVIDAHNHLGRWLSPTGDWLVPDVGELLDIMDEAGVIHIVNLDGLWGHELEENLDRYDRAHPDRFSTFCHLDLSAFERTNPTHALVIGLRRAHRSGAKGVKVWKDLGLRVRDGRGRLVMPDDDRLRPVWDLAGELGMPVMIHTADPIAFFEPLDSRNERIDELTRVPEWSFADRERFPSFDLLMEALERTIAGSPGTTFVAAHVGCCAEDLDRVDRLLRTHANMAIDISARLDELGRQPRRFRHLVLDHPDRILFGTDHPVTVEELRLHYRFVETDDEQLPYWVGSEVPTKGRWLISAAHLPADVLPGLYSGNARDTLRLGIA